LIKNCVVFKMDYFAISVYKLRTRQFSRGSFRVDYLEFEQQAPARAASLLSDDR